MLTVGASSHGARAIPAQSWIRALSTESRFAVNSIFGRFGGEIERRRIKLRTLGGQKLRLAAASMWFLPPVLLV